jgi:A nuclease family of the HNH/ENDO VII superfamily with conserved AHH
MPDHESVKGKDRIMWYEKNSPNPVKYKNNCATIPTYNKHHILPGVSMEKSITIVSGEAGKENFLSALKYFTKWNINDAHNLIPLPGISTYRALYGKKGEHEGPIPPPGPGSLPCHQTTNWGHTIYNVQVEKDLMKVWKQVSITIEDHKLNSNDVSGAITGCETKWKAQVTTGRTPTLEKWRATMAGDESGPRAAYNEFTMVELDSSPI